MKNKDISGKIMPLPLLPEGIPHGFVGSDPQGSYTGKPVDPWEEPVQDADDL